jgi:hypothetical protein
MTKEFALKVVAIVQDRALLTKGLRLADAPAVKDERVGCARPALARHRTTQSLLDELGVVRRGNADAIRYAEHVSIDGEGGYTHGVT